MWGYYWGYTSAQIELLAIDTPLITYNNRKKIGKDGNPQVNYNDVRRKAEEWEKKYGGGNEKVALDLSEYIKQ